MDTRTGQLYESEAAARAADVPSEAIARVDVSLAGTWVCQRCRRPVRQRKSTPTKTGSDGRVYRWCKRCWKKLGYFG